jgi:hypothetical protein
MNTFSVSGSPNLEKDSTIITTLYDLLTDIDARQGNQPLVGIDSDVQCPDKHDHTSYVIERVAHMFESGQIKFRNTRNIKRKYAELFIRT